MVFISLRYLGELKGPQALRCLYLGVLNGPQALRHLGDLNEPLLQAFPVTVGQGHAYRPSSLPSSQPGGLDAGSGALECI